MIFSFMAYGLDLPRGCDAIRLANEMTLATRGFSHHHRYPPGTEPWQTTRAICQEVAHTGAVCVVTLAALRRLGQFKRQMSEQLPEKVPICSIRYPEPQGSICWHAMR